MLVGERKSRAEESNLIKYRIIISHREAHEPPDTLRGLEGIRALAESGEPSISKATEPGKTSRKSKKHLPST